MNKATMWILVIVALVVGGFVGFFVERNRATVKMEAYKMQVQKQISETSMMEADKTKMEQTAMMQNAPVKMAAGNIAVAENGMTLYTYDKDTKDASNCTGACATKWPPYTVTGTPATSLPAHVGVFKNDSGDMQYAWDGKPLYFYSLDKKSGDVTGDGVGGVWHVVK